ncbi:chaperone NapD [Aurantimonas sp. NFXS3]|uniref:chaperone NapD n=1 Tax=Aurantimonas sp. NFXS3 TaxID=2818434 RepID=UPI003B8CA7F4
MSDACLQYVISSAVVSALPDKADFVRAAICGMEGAEIAAQEKGKLVVLLEGSSSRFVGNRLTEIATLDGVISANMVFEHRELLATGAEP